MKQKWYHLAGTEPKEDIWAAIENAIAAIKGAFGGLTNGD